MAWYFYFQIMSLNNTRLVNRTRAEPELFVSPSIFCLRHFYYHGIFVISFVLWNDSFETITSLCFWTYILFLIKFLQMNCGLCKFHFSTEIMLNFNLSNRIPNKMSSIVIWNRCYLVSTLQQNNSKQLEIYYWCILELVISI